MTDVTGLLLRWNEGEAEAFDDLFGEIYSELKEIAHARMRGEDPGHTLNTTGLVHEAYFKLVDIERIQWSDRSHFLAIASRTMRRILIDQARKRAALKRQGGQQVGIEVAELFVGDDQAETLLELDEALTRLEAVHPRQSKVVELLYFGGLNQEEAGAVLEISQPTVARDLRFARAWLAKEWETG